MRTEIITAVPAIEAVADDWDRRADAAALSGDGGCAGAARD